MEGRAAYVRVGLLLVMGAGVLIGMLIFLAGDRFQNGVLFESYFSESVEGLNIGAPVKYRGVNVGTVTDIGLTVGAYGHGAAVDMHSPASRLVYVRYQINPARVGRQPQPEVSVREGLRVRLAMQGITGISYLELDFVDPALYPPMPLPWTPVGAYVPTIPSMIAQVQDAAQRFLAGLDRVDVVALASALQNVAEDLHRQMQGSDVGAGLAEATALVRDLRGQLRQADLPGLAADLRATSRAVRDIAESGELHRLLGQSATAASQLALDAERLAPLIAAMTATTRHADAGLADVQQALPGILRDIQEAAANLRATSEALREEPALLLRPAAPPPREEPRR